MGLGWFDRLRAKEWGVREGADSPGLYANRATGPALSR